MLTNRFLVLVTCHEFAPYLPACLQSIEAQEHDDLGLLIADDGSRDASPAIIERFLASTRTVRNHVFVRGTERRGKAFRVHELMQHVADPECVVAFLDGDDRLLNPHAARRMAAEFARGAEVAYSNFRYRQRRAPGPTGHLGISAPLPDDFDPYRDAYRTSHWFCFKAGLFPRIPVASFQDDAGAWLQRGCDQCFTLPLLHLSRATRFVPEFLVEYNDATPWQNPEDGAAAARAVALVRARGFLRPTPPPAEPITRARALAAQIAARLAELQLPDGTFPQADHYGRECAAALWRAIDPHAYRLPIQRAVAASRSRMAAAAAGGDPDCHWEFLLFALTSLGLRADPGLRRDNRRVLNWQLLLAVVEARLGRDPLERVLARLGANLHADGTIPDFDVAEDATHAVSDQYHAFATLLLDELARRFPDDARLAEWNERAYARLLAVTRAQRDPVRNGRGARQLFGYAAAFRAFARRGESFGMRVVLDLLAARQWPDGLLPLCLDDRERHFRPQPGWHGYNRYFDYAPFLGWLLATDPAVDASHAAPEPAVAAR